MATRGVTGIVPGDEPPIHDEPHVEGSRITVRSIQRQVETRGVAPETVADEHGLELAAVCAALTDYHRHPEELRRVDRNRERLVDAAGERTTLRPPDDA